MGNAFKTQRQVEFRDTDAAGIVHFSVYFTYMEAAEHALLRSLDLSVHMHDSEGLLSWPRVAAKCDYRSPARFEDVIDVELVVLRLGTKSVTYEATFRVADREVAVCEVTAVCCRLIAGEPMRSVPVPEAIASKLRGFLSQ